MRASVLILAIGLIWSCSPSVAEDTAPAPAPNTHAALIRNPIAATSAADTVEGATIVFAEPEYLFGEVPQGEVVTHRFPFTNTGNAPLLITKARSTCGCTASDYPTDPIPPGGSGSVEVTFNTAHKYGLQRKPVTIIANTLPAMTTIYVQGTVLTE